MVRGRPDRICTLTRIVYCCSCKWCNSLGVVLAILKCCNGEVFPFRTQRKVLKLWQTLSNGEIHSDVQSVQFREILVESLGAV